MNTSQKNFAKSVASKMRDRSGDENWLSVSTEEFVRMCSSYDTVNEAVESFEENCYTPSFFSE